RYQTRRALGNVAEEVFRHRADATRDDVIRSHAEISSRIRKGVSGDWIRRICDRGIGEIPAALRIARHKRLDGLCFPVIAESLVGSEDEEFVLYDGGARRSAKLILLQGRHTVAKEIARVERIVAHEFPCTTVKPVGAGL